jgi:hypothetical protein
MGLECGDDFLCFAQSQSRIGGGILNNHLDFPTHDFVAHSVKRQLQPFDVKIADETVYLRHVLNDSDADRFALGLRAPQEYGRRGKRENSASSNADILKQSPPRNFRDHRFLPWNRRQLGAVLR